MDYNAKLDTALSALHDEGRYRVFMDIVRKCGTFPRANWNRPDGEVQEISVWCGNDYLGMGQNPVVLEAMHAAIDDAGAGSGGTRNISGTTAYHTALEAEIADLHQKKAALVFTSAYIANEATLSVLPKLFPGLIIFSDALNHASMIEGIKNGKCDKKIWRHNDLAHLRELLEAAIDEFHHIIIDKIPGDDRAALKSVFA
ncbi:MAG: aminotransferase class I/II-fold pyridoxal phosphate-dependent enzyme [Rhodobacteraceae bacterium]|nr:aminotransferase class I/II-fold pyridoxal phosphate-dependent enzyme [Paracoccaceae bacterium]